MGDDKRFLQAVWVGLTVVGGAILMFPSPFSWIVIGLVYLWVFKDNAEAMRIFLIFEVVAVVTFLIYRFINPLLALVFLIGLSLVWLFFAFFKKNR